MARPRLVTHQFLIFEPARIGGEPMYRTRDPLLVELMQQLGCEALAYSQVVQSYDDWMQAQLHCDFIA